MGMSIGTLMGVLFGFGLFIASIATSTNNYLIFISGASFLMVAGGTLASSFISFQARYVILAIKELPRLFKVQRVGRKTLNTETGMVIKWGLAAKKGGLIALEKQIKSIRPKDPYLIYGLELVSTGYSGEEVRDMLTATIESTFERNLVPASILRYMSSTAPAFGMIGTLVGLIIMLESMGADSSQLGKGLAVALTTTLYGVLMARLIFLPGATKATQKEEISRFRKYLLLEGFVMLAEDRGPRYMVDKMNSFLDPEIQYRTKRLKRKKT